VKQVTFQPAAGGPAAGDRSRVRVAGTLHRVTASRGGGPALRAELGGGPERVTIVWLGRERIPGIEPGRVLAVEGRLTRQRGRSVIYNPRYELAAAGPPAPRR
jgi:hypothetical protein